MSTKIKLGIVVNPVGAAEQAGSLKSEISAQSLTAKWFETTEDDPGLGQTMEALDWGPDVVIACGGDGTVRACADAIAYSGVPLAIVPAGTGNLLARNLEISEDVEQALDTALHGRDRKIDLGIVEGERFAVMAGAGLDAVIMDSTTREAKNRLGVLAYITEAARHVLDETVAATLRIGDEAFEGKWATILVGNLGELQGGIDLFPESSPADGRLDILGLSAETAAGTLAGGVQAALGVSAGRLLRRQSHRFSIDFEQPTPYELDGEARDPKLSLSFAIEPGSLVVRTPNPV